MYSSSNIFKNMKQKEYFIKRQLNNNSNNFEEEYWGIVKDPDGKIRDVGDERNHKLEWAKEEIRFINNLDPGVILDIGCGIGAVLEGIDDGWEKHGVEVSKYAAAKANNYGKIFLGELHNAKYPSNYFDAILLFHVIEHLNSPIEVLIEIHRILKDGGYLIVGTPDFDCACARRYGDNFRLLHDNTDISLFSNESLHRMLFDYGFSILQTDFNYFESKYFTKENLLRLFNTKEISPPFYGNIMTKYCKKLSMEEAYERIKVLQSTLDSIFKEDKL